GETTSDFPRGTSRVRHFEHEPGRAKVERLCDPPRDRTAWVKLAFGQIQCFHRDRVASKSMANASEMKFTARAPRVPVYAQLSAGDALRDGWCLNISKSGAALTGTLASPTLAAGSTLEIALELPEALAPLRLRLCIEWLQRLPGPQGVENAVLGGS